MRRKHPLMDIPLKELARSLRTFGFSDEEIKTFVEAVVFAKLDVEAALSLIETHPNPSQFLADLEYRLDTAVFDEN